MLDIRASWHVAANDLRLIMRDRSALFWSFVGPFLFITFFGLIFADPGSAPRKASLYLENQDASPVVARAFAMLLREQGIMVREGQAPEGSYALIIPPAAADSLAAGIAPAVILRSPNENPSAREQALLAATFRGLLGSVMGLSGMDATAAIDSTEIHERVIVEPTLSLSEQDIEVSEIAMGFQRYLPAYLVMFILMNSMTGGGILLVMERKTGQLRRILTSAIRPVDLVIGKIISRFLWTCSQILVMVLVGVLIYRVRFGTHPEALIAVLLAFSLCATAMGMLFGTLFKNPEKAGGFGTLLVLLLAPLGGLWWPLEFVPKWMQRIADFLPTGWAFDALNRIMALNVELASVSTHLFLLLGLTLVCLPIASRRIPRPD